jgi:hypothetical protein
MKIGYGILVLTLFASLPLFAQQAKKTDTPPTVSAEQKLKILPLENKLLELGSQAQYIQTQAQSLQTQFADIQKQIADTRALLGKETTEAQQGVDSKQWVICSLLQRGVPGCTQENDPAFIAVPQAPATASKPVPQDKK